MSIKKPLPCACGSGQPGPICCERIINNKLKVGSALALMRSRYVAYAQKNVHYILDTWHPETRPEELQLEDEVLWLNLKVLAHKSEKNQAHVEFKAVGRRSGRAFTHHELSIFRKLDDRWFFYDGEVKRN